MLVSVASKKIVGELTSNPLKTDLVQLCSSMNPIIFKNYDGREMTFTPDGTIGYFEFDYSFGFPVRNFFKTGIHPNVIASCFQTAMNKYLNYEHQMKCYDQDRDDRIIGHIVAVNFPSAPNSDGWKIQADESKVPFVSGVAAFYKKSQGLNRILGEHVTGKHKWAVSMEVDWSFDEDCGFAVSLNSGARGTPKSFLAPIFDFSPEDFLKSGWEYIPYGKAPAELRATFSIKKNKVMAQWKGREVVVLMGGLNNPIEYAGLALVRAGAEKPAKINRLTASLPAEEKTLAESLLELPKLFRDAMLSKIIKK